MSSRHWTFALLLLAANACEAGPRMYKSVGADGKVVYTDRPPIESAMQTQVMQASNMKPMAGFSATSERESYLADASSGTLSHPIRPNEDTLVKALARQRIAHVLLALCAGGEAKSAALTTVPLWRERNRRAIAQNKLMLGNFILPGRRVEMETVVYELEQAERKRLAAFTPARLEQWCGATVDALSSGKLDIVEPPVIPSRRRYGYHDE